jgi:DNA-binding LacI/PurR family transcriptional regulator
MAQGKLTSFDVAEAAGVSQSTVSRALRGHPLVNEETRLRVMAAAERLGYVVDSNATRLRTGRARSIALVMLVEDSHDVAAINPFYQSLLGCVASASADCGYSLLVSLQDESSLFAGFEIAGQVDGTIVIGSGKHAKAWQFFEAAGRDGAKIVSWGAGSAAIAPVMTANRDAAFAATEHMIAAGCRDIICLSTEEEALPQFADRRQGYLDALKIAGIAAQIHQCDERLDRVQQGYQAIQACLKTGAAFDGVFAVADRIAIGAMKALQDHGLAIPRDVAIAGFDGINACEYLSPSLTSMEQNFPAIAGRLVGNIIALIEGDPVDTAPIPATLVVRESTRR